MFLIPGLIKKIPELIALIILSFVNMLEDMVLFFEALVDNIISEFLLLWLKGRLKGNYGDDFLRKQKETKDSYKKIHCYRGMRLSKRLPVRGQRTRTNARSRRGAKKTVTGKKK